MNKPKTTHLNAGAPKPAAAQNPFFCKKEMNTIDKIKELKRRDNVVILAHYYTLPEVQDIADFVGDSLALSQRASLPPAATILFAGVKFMAETAKVLSPDKRVLLPDMEAGCSLAASCDERDFGEFVGKYPDHLVVSYVNTSVGVKALTDICCTSSNAVEIVRGLPAEQKIIFAPDRNLGNYIKSVTGRENMVIWDGACHVHEEFSVEKIIELKAQYPRARVVAHPECKAAVLLLADFTGSTAALLDFCSRDEATEFIVVTEAGILHQMAKNNPAKTFIPAPPLDSTCGCSNCAYMKLITLPKILNSLETNTHEITIDEPVRRKAEASIRRMLET
ncbi:MAG: quinolinate synthase NadA [Rikenellaceae bacterium]|jgi:quinolinate synthase|nr:quinolinate synthase NadA [Rikenellaceae bacterium]